MALTRRMAIEHGISYGSGTINYHNDTLVYDRALRSFPQDDSYAALKAAVDEADLAACKESCANLREVLGMLAMSELFEMTDPLLEALDADSLPAVEDMENFEEAYCEMVSFLEDARGKH